MTPLEKQLRERLAFEAKGETNEVYEKLWDYIVSLAPLLDCLIGVARAADELCPAGPDFDDDRLSWANYQIDKRSMAEFNEALAALKQEIGGA